MTTKRTTRIKPIKQSHFADIFMTAIHASEFILKIEPDLSKDSLVASMVAGIILPDDPMQSPCSYFSFSGNTPETVDKTLINIRAAPAIGSYGSQSLIDLMQMLIRKFPPVKRV